MITRKPVGILRKSEQPNGKRTDLRPYSSPHLIEFGTISNLTAGGSGRNQEFFTPRGLPWRRI